MKKKFIIFTTIALIIGLIGFTIPVGAKTLDSPPTGADLRIYRIVDAISGEIYKFNYSTGTYETDTGSGGSEVDPVFTSSVAYGISSGDITNWNGKLSSFTELDPVFVESVAHGISTQDITNWNNKLSSYTETDPVVKALNGIIKSNGSTISAITDNSSNWNTAFGWGNHASANYLTGVTVDSPLSGAGTPSSHLTVDLSSKQNTSSSLTSLAGLTWTSGSPLVKMTATNTFGLDSTAYLTGNQNITLSGDLSGSGATSISGTVTGIQGKAITLSTGLLKYNGSAWTFDNSTYENISNKGTVSGYAGLDASSKVPTVNLGGSGASASTYLRGDQTWATVTASPPDAVTNISLVDEFLTGNLATGSVGNLGWQFTTTAPTVTASVANHPGIRRINTSATSGNANAFWAGGAANNDLIQSSEQWDFTYIVSIPTITTVEVFVGAMDAMTTAVGNQQRYGLAFNPATSAFWRMTTGNGTSSTSTNTDITVGAGTWYALRVVRTAIGVDYYVDGVLKGSIATTLPTTALSFGAHVQTLTTTARNLDIDLFRMTLALTRTGAK